MKGGKAHPIHALPVTFKALSDPTRLRILALLAEREVCVCHLCDVLRMVQPKVSRHLAYLKKAGIITARRDGHWTHYRWVRHPNPVASAALDSLRRWMLKDAALASERDKLEEACR